MAYFAKIENNIVTEVISISNEVCGEPTLVFPDTDSAGRAYIANGLKFDGSWLQTSYNGNFRGCFAGIGYTWNGTDFVPPADKTPIEP
jgi:hypothetical protein